MANGCQEHAVSLSNSPFKTISACAHHYMLWQSIQYITYVLQAWGEGTSPSVLPVLNLLSIN